MEDGISADRQEWMAQDAQMMANRITHVKKIMREAWVKSQGFQLSNEVTMAEDDILTRLKMEDALRQYKGKLQTPHLRKHHKMRWASAVGKRMLTQRLGMRGRVSIMEHRRSAAWAEAEYKNLRCEFLKNP